MIKATISADQTELSHTWDATSWFEQAHPNQIEWLREAGWGDSYPANDVAWWFRFCPADGEPPREPEVDEILNRAEFGYLVTIDGDAAEKWLAERAS